MIHFSCDLCYLHKCQFFYCSQASPPLIIFFCHSGHHHYHLKLEVSIRMSSDSNSPADTSPSSSSSSLSTGNRSTSSGKSTNTSKSGSEHYQPYNSDSTTSTVTTSVNGSSIIEGQNLRTPGSLHPQFALSSLPTVVNHYEPFGKFRSVQFALYFYRFCHFSPFCIPICIWPLNDSVSVVLTEEEIVCGSLHQC